MATIKHAHHEFDIDHPGKDSYKHRNAGAAEVIVISDKRWAQIRELDGQPQPDLSQLLSQLGGNIDLVLVEGYKHGQHPKLELRRKDLHNPELAPEDSAIKAIVCDYSIESAGVPVLDRANVPAIADFILTAC